MKSIAILGAGGHGNVVAETALLGQWSKVTFFDDNTELKTTDYEIAGDSELLRKHLSEFDGIHIAIGNNKDRMKSILSFQSDGVTCETIIHPSVIVSPSVKILSGSSLMAGAIVCSSTFIGSGVIINTSSSINHDCTISNGCHISPGVNIAGNVFIGESSWIGTGSSIIQDINIGKDTIIGAHSAVVSNIADEKTAFGVPCKVVDE